MSFEDIDVSSFGADNARSNGGGKIKGISYGEHPFSDSELFGIAQSDGREFILGIIEGNIFLLESYYGNICALVSSHEGGCIDSVSVEHFNKVGIFYYMGIGDDMSFFVKNNARAGAYFGRRSSKENLVEPVSCEVFSFINGANKNDTFLAFFYRIDQRRGCNRFGGGICVRKGWDFPLFLRCASR